MADDVNSRPERAAGRGSDHPLAHTAWRFGSGQDRLLGIGRMVWICGLAALGTVLLTTTVTEPGIHRYSPVLLLIALYPTAFMVPAVMMARSMKRLVDTGMLMELRLSHLRAGDAALELIRQPMAACLAPAYTILAVLLLDSGFREGVLVALPAWRPGLSVMFWVVVAALPLYVWTASAMALAVMVAQSPRFLGSTALLAVASVFFVGFIGMATLAENAQHVLVAGFAFVLFLLTTMAATVASMRTQAFADRFWGLSREPASAGEGE